MHLTQEHLMIIALLRADPRRRFIEISRRTRIPLERVFELFFELKKNDVLQTTTYLKDKGAQITIVAIAIPNANPDGIIKILEQNMNVNSILLSEREIILELGFDNLNEYDSFFELAAQIGLEIVGDYYITQRVL